MGGMEDSPHVAALQSTPHLAREVASPIVVAAAAVRRRWQMEVGYSESIERSAVASKSRGVRGWWVHVE